MTRPGLTQDVIYEAALQIVDSDGLDLLTMRRLATDLGVATMSLYGHVPTKEHLLLGVVDIATAEIALPGADVPPWDALRAITREFRRVALRHPNLVPLITLRPPTGPQGLRTLEAAFDALARAGVDPAGRARAYRLMASFAIGFVSLEVGGFFRPPGGGIGGSDPGHGAPELLPRTRETLSHLTNWDCEAEFESGMELIVDGLARGA